MTTRENLKTFIETSHNGKITIPLEMAKEIYEDLGKIKKVKKYLKKWFEQLGHDGLNTKSMVRNDIQYLLKELSEVERDGSTIQKL